jgi:hypothetical protein
MIFLKLPGHAEMAVYDYHYFEFLLRNEY